MRALILAAAAAAHVAVAAPAVAAEWSVSLGGFFIGGVAFTDIDGDANDVAIARDSEIHFDARLVTDRGLTFGVDVELEASTEGDDDQIDENFLFVSGDFGRVEIGEADGAGDQLTQSPAGCALSCAADGDGFLFDYLSDAGPGRDFEIDNDGADSSDDLKITYLSPRVGTSMAGVRAGVSYAPADNDDGNVSDVDDERNFIELGARLDVDLLAMMNVPAEIDFSAAVFNEDTFEDPSYVFAGDVVVGDFDVSSRYSYRNTGGEDESTLSFGVGYEVQAWFFGASYVTVLDSDVRTEDDQAVSVEANYSLAPGVGVSGVLEFADVTGQDEAFAAGLLMEISF